MNRVLKKYLKFDFMVDYRDNDVLVRGLAYNLTDMDFNEVCIADGLGGWVAIDLRSARNDGYLEGLEKACWDYIFSRDMHYEDDPRDRMDDL